MILEEIKMTMKSKGISQKQLAELLKIDKSTVSNYLSGRRNPDIKTLENIFKLLKMSIKK